MFSNSNDDNVIDAELLPQESPAGRGRPEPPVAGAEEVLDEAGTLRGWLVPGPSGGKLFRPRKGYQHPNHELNPGGRPPKAVRDRMRNLLDDNVLPALERALKHGLVCSDCGKQAPNHMTFKDLQTLLDKLGKYSLGTTVDHEVNVQHHRPVVQLPALGDGQ